MHALFTCKIGRKTYEKSIDIDFAPMKGMPVALPVGRAVIDYAGLDLINDYSFWYVTLKPVDREFTLTALDEKLLRQGGWNDY